MPLYVADYLADTGHLSAAEHGAYLLLIMHYWQHGGIPDDDAQIARIARMSPKEWAARRYTIADLFSCGWQHKRIDAEMAKASEITARRSAAGKAGASARYSKGNGNRIANAEQSNRPTPTPLPSVPNGTAAETPPDPVKALWDRGKSILGERAGPLIGKARKEHGDIAVMAAISACEEQNPSDPAGYFAKCLTIGAKRKAAGGVIPMHPGAGG
jgi:uncharacterized protein YdaU (DUF1376 family)